MEDGTLFAAKPASVPMAKDAPGIAGGQESLRVTPARCAGCGGQGRVTALRLRDQWLRTKRGTRSSSG